MTKKIFGLTFEKQLKSTSLFGIVKLSRQNYQQRGALLMIAKKDADDQLSAELKFIFRELKIFHFLKQANITKSFGYSCSYIFTLIFSLIFE